MIMMTAGRSVRTVPGKQRRMNQARFARFDRIGCSYDRLYVLCTACTDTVCI